MIAEVSKGLHLKRW